MATCFVEIFSLLINFGDLLVSFFISLQNDETYFKIEFSEMKGEDL